MPTTITIRDETTGGESLRERTLEFLTETVTVRELIRARVYQEVEDYHLASTDVYQGLVQPEGSEVELNGFRLRKARQLDWRKQFDRAVEAFERNGVVVIVDDRQVEDLEQEVVLRPDTAVSFIKILPLIGG